MAYVWMFIAGCAVVVVVGLVCFMWGVGVQSRQQVTEQLRKLGVTREDGKIYRDAMQFIADLTSHASFNDALAPIEEQTLLSDANKIRAGNILARHREEHS